MTVSEQIIQVVNVLCEKFGIAIDWTNDNVIPYLEVLCRKLITYKTYISITWMVIMILFSVGSIIAAKKLAPIFKKGLEKQNRYECGWDILTGFAITVLICFNLTTVIVAVTQIMDIIKCLTFPEMYVFEYVSSLIK